MQRLNEIRRNIDQTARISLKTFTGDIYISDREVVVHISMDVARHGYMYFAVGQFQGAGTVWACHMYLALQPS